MDKSKWEYKKLGELCDKGSSNIAQNKIEDITGKYPLYGASGYVKGIDFYHQEKPYIGIVKDGSGVGRTNMYPAKSSLLGTMQYIIPKDGCEIGFLLYVIKGLHLENYKTGAAIPHIYFKDYGKSIVPFPPLADQQRIVAELDCLNEMIALKQEQLKEFDKLAQSIFYDMFTAREEEFKIVKLGDVVKVVPGLVNPNEEPYCSQLHVSPANIISGTGEIVNCVQAKDEGLISDKYPFKKGMVLYSKIRPNLNKVAVAEFDGVCSADMYPLSALPKANNIYIAKLLSTKNFLEFAIKNSGRARMPKLNRETLFSYTFPLPPLALQQQFAEKIQALEAQKELVKKSIAETQHLLDSRMDLYFD